MKTNEVNKFMSDSHAREWQVLHEIAQSVRALLPVLKDQNLHATAKCLEDKLTLLDAVKEERDQFVIQNAFLVLDSLISNMSSREEKEEVTISKMETPS